MIKWVKEMPWQLPGKRSKLLKALLLKALSKKRRNRSRKERERRR